ncbi:Uncharacterised protein [Klebsiella oxytoca]|nr:Uncharacterised protein [Klebsiella oxytoca]
MIFILDKVKIPWENIFIYGDTAKAATFFTQFWLPAPLNLPRSDASGGKN